MNTYYLCRENIGKNSTYLWKNLQIQIKLVKWELDAIKHAESLLTKTKYVAKSASRNPSFDAPGGCKIP